MSKVHDLINYERKKRGIPTVYWSREMARLAQSRANHCAKVGRLVHSNRFAFQGGENLAEGGETFNPRAIVDCWLGSKAGHREYLLSPRAKKAGVGISKSKGKTYVAWAFSDEPASYPDCPYFKPPRPKTQKPKKERVPLRMKFQGIRKSSQIQKTFARLFLNLLVLAGLGFLIRHSYLLFTQPTAPLKNSIILLIGITVWILLIRLLRKKYRWTKPSFKLTTFSVVAILLILTFAGVQPLAGYKDSLIESYRVAQAERAAQAQAEEAARAAQEEAEAATKAEQEAVAAAAQAEVESEAIAEAERETFRLINAQRGYAGVPPTEWDDELYELSKAHTQAMAERKECFHSYEYGDVPYGENAWGGESPYHYSPEELPQMIVNGWSLSPLHWACLLHAPVKRVAVSIVVTPTGQYASWTFWWSEFGEGPEILQRAVKLWQAETGGSMPWTDWLDSKGYPYNTDWLYEQ
jgi:uncharacterized protein YkwD